MAPVTTIRVAVIAVVFGQSDAELGQFLRALAGLDHPALGCYLALNEPGRDVANLDTGRVPTRIVDTGQNLGWTGGVNRAAAAASLDGWERLLLLNTDVDLLTSDLVERLSAAFDRPDCAFASPTMVLRSDRRRIWYRGASIVGSSYATRHDSIGKPLTSAHGDVIAVRVGCSCAMLVDAERFLELGGFDERLFMYYEDVDLALRAEARGWRTYLVDAPLVAHHVAGQRRSAVASYYFGRNPLLLVAKHSPPARMLLGIVAHLTRSSRYLARADSPSAAAAYLRGMRDGLGAVISSRRPGRFTPVIAEHQDNEQP